MHFEFAAWSGALTRFFVGIDVALLLPIRPRPTTGSRRLATLVLGCLWWGATPAGDALDPDRGPPDSPALVLGTQPLGYPSGVVSAVMGRDRILRKALAAHGLVTVR